MFRSQSFKILIVVILLLVGATAYFAFQYVNVQKEFQQTKALLETQKTNEKVLDFTKLFIKKVLKAEGEVDFETRLSLETSVRGLNDKEILSQWQTFVASKGEAEAQAEVKNLLGILIKKIEE